MSEHVREVLIVIVTVGKAAFMIEMVDKMKIQLAEVQALPGLTPRENRGKSLNPPHQLKE
jgi:hypothetical protein